MMITKHLPLFLIFFHMLIQQCKRSSFAFDALLSLTDSRRSAVQQQQQQAQSTDSRGKMFRSSKEARTFK